MSKYRHRLPQLQGGLFLTDGGLETTLIFHKGMELPHFAAFDLLRDTSGRETLKQYYLPYIQAARSGATVSSSTALLGVPIPIGAASSVIRRKRSRLSTEMGSSFCWNCGPNTGRVAFQWS